MGKKKKNRIAPETLGLPLVGVESHAHLDLKDFAEDLDEVFARAARSGVAWIGNVFLGPDAYVENVKLFDGRENVFFLLGVHPNDADKVAPGYIGKMREAITGDARIRALGEIGLDYYWGRVPADVQKREFAAQLRLAKELGIPVVIHSRDADEDAIEVLLAEGFKDRPVLWHCFGGDRDRAKPILDNGWHISVPGPVTYKANEALRDAVAYIGLERLMVETDCPYLSPEPWRGKRNEPAFVVFTAARIAEILGVTAEEVWARTGENARKFFELIPEDGLNGSAA